MLENMERHLRALAAGLSAASGYLRAGERVVSACAAIVLRMNELAKRVDDGDADAVSESIALLR